MFLRTHSVKNTLLFLCSITVAVTYSGENNDPLIENNYLNQESVSPLGIIEGFDDTTDRYPFAVSMGVPRRKSTLYKNFFPLCSGSLISDQWVLTAAHCFNSKPTLIRYGNMAVPPNDTRATYSDVLKRIPHHNYFRAPMVAKNDIGLLLVKKVYYNHFGRISSVDYRTLIGLPVVYVGFGNTNTSDETSLSIQLINRQYGEAAILPCSRLIFDQPVLCLARKCANKAQQAYFGDSGGPLLHFGRIVGVCLRGVPEFPGQKNTVVYTAASPFQDWIVTTISQYSST